MEAQLNNLTFTTNGMSVAIVFILVSQNTTTKVTLFEMLLEKMMELEELVLERSEKVHFARLFTVASLRKQICLLHYHRVASLDYHAFSIW